MNKQEKENTSKSVTVAAKTELAGAKIFGKHQKMKEEAAQGQVQGQQAQGQVPNRELAKLKEELNKLKTENFNLRALSALEKSGCIKPELALKALPADCKDITAWVDGFKTENEILFKSAPVNHGGSFKPTQCSNLSPTEIMNNYIRGIN